MRAETLKPRTYQELRDQLTAAMNAVRCCKAHFERYKAQGSTEKNSQRICESFLDGALNSYRDLNEADR